MRIGTKSLLFGAHQFILHPLTVLIAWYKIYRWFPTWREFVCILIHDWGYWGCRSMDGSDGGLHSAWAADWVSRHFSWQGGYYYFLCLYHSRHIAKAHGNSVSRLFYADKLSFAYLPWWLYVPMTLMSKEIWEYRQQTTDAGITPAGCTHREWHRIVRGTMVGLSKSPTFIPYLHGVDPR